MVIEGVGLKEVLSFARVALARSNYVDEVDVLFGRAREIRVETQPPGLEFTVDGEVIGNEPAEFTVVPRALKVIVGPGYVPEPEE